MIFSIIKRMKKEIKITVLPPSRITGNLSVTDPVSNFEFGTLNL